MVRGALKAGAIGGIIGGVMMAVWLMFILWLTGTGFWTLLNLITNTVWRSAPLGSKFSLAAVIIGLIVHVLVSFLFGSLIVVAAWRLPGPRSLIIASGALFGPVIWLVMQFGIWHAVDPAAAQVITPWVFAVAHLIFGLLAAATAAILTSDEKRSADSTKLIVDGPLAPAPPAIEGQSVPGAAPQARPGAGPQARPGAGPQARPGAGRHVFRYSGSPEEPNAEPTARPSRARPGLAPQRPGLAPERPGPAPERPGPAPADRGPAPEPPPATPPAPVWHPRRITARNVGGLRTVVYTSGGPGMVTDEPVQSGGTGTALTPLETVVGALCGSIGATFAIVAREAGFRYDGLDFEASFAAGSGGPVGQPGVRLHFQTVRVIAQVRAAQPDPRLPDVARLTERRCPVRNLLADAGARVELAWSGVSPSPAAGTPPDPGASRRPASWP
jgi:uncharacterized OsmC-like protein